MIISHNHYKYRQKWRRIGNNKYNGAFYYSKEIVKNIIPNVITDRNWITINIKGVGCDHAIVFVHNNLHPENYDWLKKYDDLILVCGVESTCDKVKHLGKAIYLPLSIDVEYVKQFKLPAEQRHGEAYVGRYSKRQMETVSLPNGVHVIEGCKRQNLLPKMARYESIYAVGRTAIEAKCLGCEIKPYDSRYPDVSVWQVVDNKEAAQILQKKLNEIDGTKYGEKEERENST